MNTDVAQELSDRKHARGHQQRWERVAEVVEVLFLAVVATATAWSGYQAAKWDGREAALYQRGTLYRFQAQAASDLGGLELVSDSALFTGWLQARAADQPALAKEFVRRFTPDFRTDFEAWLQTDGTDAAAENDIGFMPDYASNPHVEEAAALNARSSAAFIEGRKADSVADKYVRNTVLLATVLFLVALAQRFDKRELRMGVNAGAFLMLVYVVGSTATLARLP